MQIICIDDDGVTELISRLLIRSHLAFTDDEECVAPGSLAYDVIPLIVIALKKKETKIKTGGKKDIILSMNITHLFEDVGDFHESFFWEIFKRWHATKQ